jgi:NAD(P)H-dependent FMN reductase
MSKILAFGASNSKNSINSKLATYTVNKIAPDESIIIDLNDFEMPIYSEDREKIGGIPEKALKFKKLISECDGIVISLAEHNGAYTAAFKNIFDWISVVEKVVWCNKPLFLLAASNGSNGAKTVLQIAEERFSRQSNLIIPVFSLPNFSENFSEEFGITNQTLLNEIKKQIIEFKKQVDTLLDS